MTYPKRSGLIPVYFDYGRIYVRCMIPSNSAFGGNMPQMAKGHIERGLSYEENAIKEAQEELGLKESNIYDVSYLGNFTRIACYTCLVHDPDDFDDPHWESEWSGWVDITEGLNDIRDVQQDIFIECLNHWSNVHATA